MSQNPAHTHRRALSPPAVTRFQMRTPGPSEAVFAPPYVPTRAPGTRLRPPVQPVPYIPFPEPSRQPPAIAAPPRRVELPRPTQSTEVERRAPGSWREIIARIDVGLTAEEASPTEVEQSDLETVTSPPPADVEAPSDAHEPSVKVDQDDERAGLPWDVYSMTTPDYTAPQSIHDAGHDAWPVEAADGDAIAPWSDDEPDDADADETGELILDQIADSTIEQEEIGELILDQVVGESPAREPDAADPGSFPLDAFIVPAGVHHAPEGYDAEVAQLVAHRLDQLARELRTTGLAALGTTSSVDDLSRVLAAIVTGYVARDA